MRMIGSAIVRYIEESKLNAAQEKQPHGIQENRMSEPLRSPLRGFETMNITLPSGRTAEIREMTVRDEKILLSAANIINGTSLNDMLAEVVLSLDGEPMPEDKTERGELLLDMLSGDRSYLILLVRILSYGPEMVFDYECPKCCQTSGYKLNLSKMLEDGTLKIYPYREDMPLIVETRAGPAEINYPTGRTEKLINRQIRNDREPDTLMFAAAFCTSLNGRKPTIDDMEELPVRDIIAIRKAGSELRGGLDITTELDCPKCGESNAVYLPRLYGFIPFVTMGKNIKYR